MARRTKIQMFADNLVRHNFRITPYTTVTMLDMYLHSLTHCTEGTAMSTSEWKEYIFGDCVQRPDESDFDYYRRRDKEHDHTKMALRNLHSIWVAIDTGVLGAVKVSDNHDGTCRYEHRRVSGPSAAIEIWNQVVMPMVGLAKRQIFYADILSPFMGITKEQLLEIAHRNIDMAKKVNERIAG